MENLEDLPSIFDVVGRKLRVYFMIALRDGPRRPSKVSKALDAPLSNLYMIFNELKEVKLIESFEKEGIIYWRLTNPGKGGLMQILAFSRGRLQRKVLERKISSITEDIFYQLVHLYL